MIYQLSDIQILEAMHRHYNEGMSLSDAGAPIGKGRNSMAGLMKRIRDDTNASDPDGNQNGTMPAKWWKK